MRHLVVALLCAGLAACASAPRQPAAPPVAALPPPTAAPGRCAGVVYAPAQEDLSKRGDYVAGGLFRPGERDSIPGALPDVDCIPEPQVVALERSKLGNKPVYTVLDREYRVLDDTRGFVEEGLASYYGQKFHGRRTSNWEVYDMYAFTAAHKTLPLPSFARVTNLANGRSVIVRVNDRGPFHEGRVMDLSFAAAVKLGIYPAGTGRVRVQAVHPGDPEARPTPVVAARPSSAMDGLVSNLPAAGARPSPSAPGPGTGDAPVVVPTTPAAPDYRYDVTAETATGSADRFEAWMKERDVRVATGRPMPVDAPPVVVEALPATGTAAPARSTATGVNYSRPPSPIPPTPPAAPSAAPAAPGAVVLQVASFSARDNAERALATLQRAGIAPARLQEAQVAGQPVWRLRVGPLAAGVESDLIARLAGLGFGSARPVRD